MKDPWANFIVRWIDKMKQPSSNATPTAIHDSPGDNLDHLSEQQVAAINEFVKLVGGVENAHQLLDEVAKLPNAA